MNCSNCGTRLGDHVHFCTACGTPVLTSSYGSASARHQKWEYYWEYATRTTGFLAMKDWDNTITDKLLRLGEEGWELVAITPRSGMSGDLLAGVTTEELWVFKRPKSG